MQLRPVQADEADLRAEEEVSDEKLVPCPVCVQPARESWVKEPKTLMERVAELETRIKVMELKLDYLAGK